MVPDNDSLIVSAESPHTKECLDLLAQLLTELSEKYPDELRGTPLIPEELAAAGAAFLVARRDGRPVGCGAIRPFKPGVAEVKRMFVVQEARGRGVGRAILENLETFATNFGYRSVRLETGLKQPEAISLYQSAGYHRAPCYGPYRENPLSVCFEKVLDAPSCRSQI
ncbi:MAG: GNAT family N-acetyltransferase [Acidobacteriota bacterium]|nr:GNAT family N-acetyltransferase [Acidobacteriota bacterium]